MTWPFKKTDEASIRQRLLFIAVSICVISIALTCGSFTLYDYFSAKKSLHDRVETFAMVLSDQTDAALAFGDSELLRESAGSLRSDRNIDLVCIYDLAGAVAANYQRKGAPDCPVKPPAASGEIDGRLHVTMPVILEGDLVGTLHIQANLLALYQKLVSYILAAGLIASAVVAFVTLISPILTARASAPLIRLADMASKIAESKDYSLRAEPFGGVVEVNSLVLAFNGMIETIQRQNQEILKSHDKLERTVDERTAELQAALVDLEAFTYSASHDMQSPLRAIDGYCGIIKEDFGEILDSELSGYINRIGATSRRMSGLITGLLNLSKVSRAELGKMTISLSEIAERIIGDLREENPSRQVRVEIQKNVRTYGDERFLGYALRNLLGNAWKYTGRRDNPLIQFGSTVIETGETAFYVRDNGAGFDSSNAVGLFEPFHRQHSSSEFEGSGIGLTIVARAIARHGGRVWAESSPDQGATFFFTLGTEPLDRLRKACATITA